MVWIGDSGGGYNSVNVLKRMKHTLLKGGVYGIKTQWSFFVFIFVFCFCFFAGCSVSRDPSPSFPSNLMQFLYQRTVWINNLSNSQAESCMAFMTRSQTQFRASQLIFSWNGSIRFQNTQHTKLGMVFVKLIGDVHTLDVYIHLSMKGSQSKQSLENVF